ncbi:Mur ligase family protein [Pedobacter immunditicola]|uniref:Mur ligase family protein n=1 Tax=Pedobacter immunditicola TaxID=3133440 RepID=UPI00309B4F16
MVIIIALSDSGFMDILQTRVMRGPNYWSAYRTKLIVVKVELKETDTLSPVALGALSEKLAYLKPPLYNLQSYNSVLDIAAQVAVEIQCLAGMDCAYSEIHPLADSNQAILCFSYTLERAGIYAAQAAVDLVNAILADQPYLLEKDIQNLISIKRRYSLDPATGKIVYKARALGIPVQRQDKHTLLLGWGCRQYALKNGEDHAPLGNIGRIPVVAVTGTNGKTTTTRLIAYLARMNGYQVGFTTTDGIYMNNELETIGDCSGPQSAAMVLNNPQVNFAVLECARGGILRAGLGFDQCQVSVVTNISEDHLGMDDIHTMEELAKVKLTVPKTTRNDGYAILNADDDRVYRMKDALRCHIALFSMNPENQRIMAHCDSGCLAAIIEDGYFTICKWKQKFRIARINEVPLCHEGKSTCMMQNVLAALLAAFVNNVPVETMQLALKKFIPSPENTPGRMNVFNFDHFSLMIDYAHNEGGYRELKKYTDQLRVSVKVGIIAAVADRPDKDIVNLGRLAAGIFDEIIIRHDSYNSGRTLEEINSLLKSGIREVKPEMPIKIISNEFEAIKYAIMHARKDAWIFVNSENVYDTLFYVSNYKTTDQNPSAPQLLQKRVLI